VPTPVRPCARRRAGALRPLRPYRQQRDQLPGLLRGGFGLLRLALLIGLPAGALTLEASSAPAQGQGYGRWESQAHHCDLRINQEARGCHAVRLEQNQAGVLSVRFLADGQGPAVASEDLLFVGQIKDGQPAMACSDDGRCNPVLPTALTVSTVAGSRYDERGLILELPRTHLARGTCTLQEARLQCEARNPAGASWAAEARMP
jgi:hypothetical protein